MADITLNNRRSVEKFSICASPVPLCIFVLLKLHLKNPFFLPPSTVITFRKCKSSFIFSHTSLQTHLQCTVKTNDKQREKERKTESFFLSIKPPALSNQAELQPPELPLQSFSICPPARHPHTSPAAEPLRVLFPAAADRLSHGRRSFCHTSLWLGEPFLQRGARWVN